MLQIQQYNGNEAEWDDFIFNRSMNGTFLQTRKFLNYHAEGKFRDASICVRKGEELVAAISACEIEDNGKVFFAHKGSTYGGISISPSIYKTSLMEELFEKLMTYLKEQGYQRIFIKMVPAVFQRENCDLLDYYLYKYGFNCYDELNYYMHLDRYKEDVLSQFTSQKRRNFKMALKVNLQFRKLETKEEIASYYEVLLKNLRKLNLPVVHSLDDLYDLKFNRFNELIDFYGVYKDEKIIAGTMVFIFNGNIMHTQYLSSDEDYLNLYPMDSLIGHLIETAIDKGFDILTLGICTEDHGKYLNQGLSRFKEGFGTEYCINRSYELKMF